MKVKSLSPVRLFETPRTAAYQAPLSMGFSRQEYWSGVPLPSPKINGQRSQIDILKKKKQRHYFANKGPSSQGYWRRQWHPTPVLWPGKSHGQRSLVGCRPWGREESDMTEQLHFHFSLPCTGEGNGNPLQCSCLENPRDGGAWWAAICGVAQSDTTEAT